MARDSRTVSSLIALGYPGNACLKKCDCDELPCPLLSWLVNELRTVCPAVQEGERQDPAVSAVLVGELRAQLKELHCPCAALTTETLTPALLNRLTEFLVSELQAARILLYRELHPEDRAKGDDTEKEQRESEDRGVDLVEENQERGGDGGVGDREGELEKTKEITQLLQALNLDPSSQLTDIYTEVESRLALLPGGAMPEPLLERALNAEQWRCLQQINQALAQDYKCRRNMMIKRFQVTLQSFTWGEKGQTGPVTNPPSQSWAQHCHPQGYDGWGPGQRGETWRNRAPHAHVGASQGGGRQGWPGSGQTAAWEPLREEEEEQEERMRRGRVCLSVWQHTLLAHRDRWMERVRGALSPWNSRFQRKV